MMKGGAKRKGRSVASSEEEEAFDDDKRMRHMIHRNPDRPRVRLNVEAEADAQRQIAEWREYMRQQAARRNDINTYAQHEVAQLLTKMQSSDNSIQEFDAVFALRCHVDGLERMRKARSDAKNDYNTLVFDERDGDKMKKAIARIESRRDLSRLSVALRYKRTKAYHQAIIDQDGIKILLEVAENSPSLWTKENAIETIRCLVGDHIFFEKYNDGCAPPSGMTTQKPNDVSTKAIADLKKAMEHYGLKRVDQNKPLTLVRRLDNKIDKVRSLRKSLPTLHLVPPTREQMQKSPKTTTGTKASAKKTFPQRSMLVPGLGVVVNSRNEQKPSTRMPMVAGARTHKRAGQSLTSGQINTRNREMGRSASRSRRSRRSLRRT